VLRQVAEGVLIHQSEFCQSNAVVVHGQAGVLLIDPGVLGYEMAALRLLEGAAGDVDVLVPGHGSIGGADQPRARIDQDRAYLHTVRDGHVPVDPRVGPSAKDGWAWVAGVHAGQLQRLAGRSKRDGTPG
jgi:hypothetical protein